MLWDSAELRVVNVRFLRVSLSSHVCFCVYVRVSGCLLPYFIWYIIVCPHMKSSVNDKPMSFCSRFSSKNNYSFLPPLLRSPCALYFLSVITPSCVHLTYLLTAYPFYLPPQLHHLNSQFCPFFSIPPLFCPYVHRFLLFSHKDASSP